ncbi:MAG: hypothetical protein NVSMB52_06890 [Chloroflexota bacterium]
MRNIDGFKCALLTVVSGLQIPAAAILQPLMRYDREEGGDLMRTLSVYLRLSGNASRSAQALYLHRSGLLYRIARIESLLGVQLNDPDDRLALEIALMSYRFHGDPYFSDLPS